MINHNYEEGFLQTKRLCMNRFHFLSKVRFTLLFPPPFLLYRNAYI